VFGLFIFKVHQSKTPKNINAWHEVLIGIDPFEKVYVDSNLER
jgi:hypothetical protein